jgi:hypothetical protein
MSGRCRASRSFPTERVENAPNHRRRQVARGALAIVESGCQLSLLQLVDLESGLLGRTSEAAFDFTQSW